MGTEATERTRQFSIGLFIKQINKPKDEIKAGTDLSEIDS